MTLVASVRKGSKRFDGIDEGPKDVPPCCNLMTFLSSRSLLLASHFNEFLRFLGPSRVSCVGRVGSGFAFHDGSVKIMAGAHSWDFLLSERMSTSEIETWFT